MSQHLADAGVEVKPYTALLADIKTLAAANTKLWTDPAKVMPPCLPSPPATFVSEFSKYFCWFF